MSHPISDQDQFEAGRQAYLADDDHLLYQCTSEFKEGYRDEMYRQNSKMFENDNSGDLFEVYWEAHLFEAVDGMRSRLLNKVMAPTPKGRIAQNTVLGTVGSFLLGIAALAGFLLMLFAPFLMTAEEVANFWKEIL
jgi:hypothetical protein